MTRRVHPVPETKVKSDNSTDYRNCLMTFLPSTSTSSGPLFWKISPDKSNSNCGSRNTDWTDTAHYAANSCCALSGVFGNYNVLECSADPDTTGASQAPPWMDYLWLCEGDGRGTKNKRRSRRTRLFLQQQPSGSKTGIKGANYYDHHQQQELKPINPNLLDADYAQLHEDFFESLLKEQGQQVLDSTKDRVLRTSESRDTCSSVSSGVSTAPSTAATSAFSASPMSIKSVETLYKKHPPLRLHRLASKACTDQSVDSSDSNANHNYHARITPIETYNQMYNPALCTSELVCLDTIMANDTLKSPSDYVHPQCILQKDKGRGQRLKSCISARGQEPCLDKLRDKMRLVLQMSSSPGSIAHGREGQSPRKSSTNSGMKRRMAKVSDFGQSFIETRSMLELQLGFLSMQYGLLIHWDTLKTGKIVFICLRKMCSDAFYSKIPDLIQEPALLLQQQQQLYPSNCQQTQQSQLVATAKQEAAPPLVVRCHKGNHAIYQRLSGSTEVVLVDAPYRVQQPEVFAPSVLTVDIHQVTGLDHRRSQWTLSVTFDGHTEIAHLQYNPQTKVYETTRTTPCKWEMMRPRQMTSFDMGGLEIRLFEQRSGRLGVRRKGIRSRDSIQNHENASNSLYGWRKSSIDTFNTIATTPKIKSTSRLASTMTMPLGGLVSQPSTSQTTVWELTIPFTHDDSAQLSLTLAHQSEYANWLYKELRARRKEELTSSAASSWQPSLLKRLVSLSYDGSHYGGGDGDDMDNNFNSEKDNGDDFYISDWLCGICYLFPVAGTK
jgi:hypothetical protein